MERQIDEIIAEMQGIIGSKELTILKNVLVRHLCQPNDKGREIAVIEDDDRIVQMFVASKTVGGRTTSSLNQYVRVLRELRELSGKNLVDVTAGDIEYFLLYFSTKRHCSQSYINSKRSYLSTFYSWLVSRGVMETNPVSQTEKARLPQRQKEVFSEEEIELLIDKAHCRRDKAIIETLLSTECRVGELCSLNIADLDFDGGKVRVYGKKGKRERVVPLTRYCIELLNDYLSERQDHNDALFVNNNGERLKSSSVQSMLSRLGTECGIHVHPHKFRRTRISQYAKKGMPLQDIAYIAGHKSMNTTYNSYVAIHEDTVIEKAKEMMS